MRSRTSRTRDSNSRDRDSLNPARDSLNLAKANPEAVQEKDKVRDNQVRDNQVRDPDQDPVMEKSSRERASVEF